MKTENWEFLADPQAERNVLGACLLAKQIPEEITGLLEPKDFYHLQNGEIYAAMERLQNRQTPVDLTTLPDELSKTDKLDRIGGRIYLTGLFEGVASAANASYHAEIILEFSVRRSLASAGREIADAAYQRIKEISELKDFAESKITALSRSRTRDRLKALKNLLEDTYLKLDEPRDFLSSGFDDLDKITGGWEPGDYVILAGRPSMGKTALALAIAERTSEKNPVGIFSLEMSARALGDRLLTAKSGVHFGRYRKDKLAEEEYRRILAAHQQLAQLPIEISDLSAIDILALKQLARRHTKSGQTYVLIVDYLQLLHCDRRENRQQEITFISGHLKALAKELGCILIVLSQLSRQVELRGGNHRPQLADLRESGAIEQDADEVLFVYRPEYYGIKEKKHKNGETTDLRGLAEIIIAKNRNGKTGECWLVFDKEYARFRELSFRPPEQDFHGGPGFSEEKLPF